MRSRELLELIESMAMPGRRSVRRRGGCGCGRVRQSVRSVLSEALSEMGIDDEVVELIVESIKCDPECEKKYMSGGRFRGRRGERFDNCVKWASECCRGVKDAEALCAAIGRMAGKI